MFGRRTVEQQDAWSALGQLEIVKDGTQYEGWSG
jgi:hypothetical protein